MRSLVALLLAFVQIASCQEEFAPVVQLTTGKVRGSIQPDENGKNVYFYNGIRYGKASRFSLPTFADPWEGIYNATSARDACPQPVHDPLLAVFQGRTFSEDCLYVSVWRPVQDKINRPVMVWIHGGGFTIGTIFSITSNGLYIASKGDVIVVSVNYRLGPFGFLYGGTEDAPGNLGLQDQILALKWVQANIRQFGGDPNQVTVFGESAGSHSVGAFILSPLAKGLFRRAIMQSGAPLRVDTQNLALERTKTFATKLNCPTSDKSQNHEMLVCLRNKTIEEISNHSSLDFIHNNSFKPIYGDSLLPLKPVEALKSGKFNRDIDLLFGVNKNEGTYFVTALYPKLDSNATLTLDEARGEIVEVMKSYNYSFADEVAQFYLDNMTNASQDELKIAVANAIGDHRITCPTILFGEQVAKFSQSSRYFSYRLTQHYAYPGVKNEPWHGVAHGEDVAFLFIIPFLGNEENRQLSRDMIQAWTEFARNGNPGTLGSVQWKDALSPTNSVTNSLTLHANQYGMVDGYFAKNCDAFWQPKIFN